MITEDQIVEYFNMTLIKAIMPKGTPIIMVYENPNDYPGQIVARLYDGKRSTHFVALADSMEKIRDAKPDRMQITKRLEQDPLKVVETWL